MKAIEKLQRQLEEVGASLDEYDFFVNCDAPSGYVWVANGETNIPIHFGAHGQTWLTVALKDGYSRLNMGLEKVEDDARIEEIRFGLDNDDWGKEIKHNSIKFIQFPKK